MNSLYKLLFGLIFIITLGYVLFVPEYSVKGLVEETNPNLVSFTNIHDIEKVGNVEENNRVVFDSSKQNLSFDISLSIPGDQYSFYADIQNNNSFPVTVEVLSNELDELSKKYLNYTVIGDHKVLDSNSTMTVQVVVEYKREIEVLPESDILTNFNTTIVATQA
jgi:hypothetical protein